MRPPQTGRQPFRVSSDERRKLLQQPNPDDTSDLFATDPNSEVNELGRLALRRNDINDLFALGDLCANLCLTSDYRLSVFYMGKTLAAYERARSIADNDIDRKMARRATDNYLAWAVQVSQAHPSRRNIAATMWALAENEQAILPHIGIDETVLQELADRYIERSLGTRVADDSVMSDDPDGTFAADVDDDRTNLDDTDPDTAIYSGERTRAYSPGNPVESHLEDENDDEHESGEGEAADDPEKTVYTTPHNIDFDTPEDPNAPSGPPVSTNTTRTDHDIQDDHLLLSQASADYDSNRATLIAQRSLHENKHDGGALGIRRRRPPRKRNRRRHQGEPSENEFDIGERIQDRWEVADVRRGGMGIVYLCYDHRDRAPVAIKSFQNRFLKNERAVARFTQEALTWIRLEKHQHIVQARIVQTISGRPHIMLEHISGPDGLGADLRSWIDHNRIDVTQAITFGLHIALGMRHATQIIPGMVHRDLKPANILVTHDGVAKVTDFGLVRSLEVETRDTTQDNDRSTLPPTEAATDDRLTRVGAIVGTAPYMSPEQCRSEDVDTRADIYSFGAVLYEMLTGHHIFRARKWEAWLYAHVNDVPSFDEKDESRLPKSLQAFVLSCLEKHPTRRPKTWGEIVDQLAALYQEITGEEATLEIDGPQLEARELMDKGYSLTELYRYDEAVETYDRALELHPDDAWIWARKGRTLRLLGDPETALETYNKALALFPNYGWAYNGKGIVLEQLERLEEALDAFARAAEIKPNEIWHWYNKANVQYALNMIPEAVTSLKKALEQDPAHSSSWAKLGQIYRQQGNFQAAVDSYEQSLRLEPDYGWAHNGAGLAYKIMGKLDKAVKHFEQAAEHAPEQVWHWYNWAETLVDLRRYREALKPAREAVAIDPDHSNSWAKLGQIYRYLKEYENAIEAYNQAIEHQPDYAWAINGKGIALENLERYEEALTCFQEAAKYSENEIWQWYNQGNVLVLMDHYEEAVPLLEEATRQNPGHARSWARLASALRHLDHYDEALEALASALEVDPTYAWAWNERGITLEQAGDYEAALQAYQQAAQIAPNEATYRYQQGSVLILMRRHEDAIEMLTSAAQMAPDDARTYAKMGQAQRYLDRYADALRSYTRAIEIDPSYSWAWNGRGLTLSMLGENDDAMFSFQKATENEPDNVWYWYNLADEYIKLERYDDALYALGRGIAVDGTHAESLAKRGQALRWLGRYEAALKSYDKALIYRPDYPWAWNGRGLTLQSLNRLEEALVSFERATEQDDRTIWYYINQVDVLLQMRRRIDALDIIDIAIDNVPDQPVAWARRGQVLRRLGEYEASVKSYERALELDPDYGWAYNGKGLAHAELEQWDEARHCYEQAVIANPEDVWFAHNFAEALLQLGDCRRAIAELERALAIHRDHQVLRQLLERARKQCEDDKD